MSEGSDRKAQLGRVQLQKKPVSPGGGPDLDDWSSLISEIEDEVREPPLVQFDELPAELAHAVDSDSDRPRVDLRKLEIAAHTLGLLTREVALERMMLPLWSDRERLFVAVTDLDARRAVDELSFTLGLTVLPYEATQGVLRDVIEAAYAAGASLYKGPLARGARAVDFDSVSKPPSARSFGDGMLSKPSSTSKLTPADLDAGDSVLPPARETKKPRILVVDDSDDIRRLLARVFRERDYEVLEASSGLEALEKVREGAPDLFLLDAMLPGGMHGFELCRRIKGSRRYGHIPIVMLSAVYRGWRFSEDLRRSYGVDAFLEKPFRIGEVVAAVERARSGAGKSQPPDDGEGLAGEQLKAGIEAYAQGDLEGAVEHLKRGIVIDPLAFRLHYHLGLLYGKQENVFEAIHELEAAADLRPRDFSTLKNLAVLYQRAGFRLKATEMWERALGCAPDDATRASIRNHLVSLL
ncbi:MAG TPA: response regulator [Polyangiales bacterium]|nr:response regulator [Polyangiales bacterium]